MINYVETTILQVRNFCNYTASRAKLDNGIYWVEMTVGVSAKCTGTDIKPTIPKKL